MDQITIIRLLKEKGTVGIKLPGGKVVELVYQEFWQEELGKDWLFLLFDLFQIRSICKPFSEVSLDIVEFASKPTIYHSPANPILSSAPIVDRLVKFSLIREPNWNKLLFQINKPVLARLRDGDQGDVEVTVPFPLQIKDVKELYLGTEGEVKIYTK